MCTTCGCGAGEVSIEETHGAESDLHTEHSHTHAHDNLHSHDHPHSHEASHAAVQVVHHHHYYGPVHIHYNVESTPQHVHPHEHPHSHDKHEHAHTHAEEEHVHPETEQFQPQVDGENLHFGQGPARSHAPGMTQSRMVQIEQDILAKNDAIAAKNRAFLSERNIKTLNMMSSPGSGKTTLLTETLRHLEQQKCTVIEGDQQTSRDADRIRATGARAIQINTGKGCHLDAQMVSDAIARLLPDKDSILFIENVGNLVCPAAFDLGESHKVAMLSVTEGEDKPLKYPDIFTRAELMLINKADLLPYLEFDLDTCIDNAKRINPDIKPLLISAATGEGMQAWLDWLGSR